MDTSFSMARAPSARQPLLKLSLIAASTLVMMIPVQGGAQTALDTASVSAPSHGGSTGAGLTIVKHAKDGGFFLTVTNKGADPVSGALVTDKVGKGLRCPAENAVSITGSGAPPGSFTLANLTDPGIVLGTLLRGQSATLIYSCQAV
jgi:hypothetical protein